MIPKRINSKGAAIVQVLAVSLVVIFISAALVGLIQATDSSYRQSRITFNIDDLHGELTLFLTNRYACYNTFKGLVKAASVDIPSLVDETNTAKYLVNLRYGKNILIKSMTASTFAIDNTFPPFNNVFTVSIVYSARLSSGTDKEKTKVFRVFTGPTTPLNDGDPLAENTFKCTSSSTGAAISGFDSSLYLSKTGADTHFTNFTTNGSITVEGNGYFNGGIFTLSDSRIKTDITPIHLSSKQLHQLQQLQAYQFSYLSDNKKHIGYMANQIEKIFPEVVDTDPITKIRAINYGAFVSILLAMNNEIAKQNYFFEEEIKKIEKQMDLRND